MTETQTPEAQAEPVEFVGARSDESVRTRLWRRAALFFFFGVWCVGAAFAGHPVAGALAAALWLELGGACLCALSVAGGTSNDPALMERVGAAVREVCRRAGCPPPRVALAADARRPAGIRRAKGRPVLTLAVAYVERIDDAQLRAIVGHEVAHVTGGDLAAARRRSFLTAVPALVLSFAWGYNGADPVVAPMLVAAYVAAAIAISAAVAPANRPREARADTEAARLCGDPAATIAALRQAYAVSEETRRRAYPWPVARILLAPLIWRLPTHPPLAERVARLEALAGQAGVA